MESQAVNRRLNMIAAHLAVPEDVSTAATRVFPMSCSSSLNSAIWRCDNRTYFSRQGSSSQACFMRLNSKEQGSCTQSALPFKTSDSANKDSGASEAPTFSRPASIKPFSPSNREIKSVAQGRKYNETAAEAPNFSRPSTTIADNSYLQVKERRNAFESKGCEWSSRMVVADSGCKYFVSIELPGVNINDIRVEVSDQSLTISGNRSTQWWKVASYSNDMLSTYHKKEMLQGPFRVYWPLPTNANKDSISAEFVNGLLQITVSKL